MTLQFICSNMRYCFNRFLQVGIESLFKISLGLMWWSRSCDAITTWSSRIFQSS